MITKPTWQQRVFQVFNTLFMIFMVVIAFYPMWHVLCASLSNASEYIAHRGLLLLPLKPTLAAYENAFQHPLILGAYGNTLFIVVTGTVMSTILSAIAAYFISRKRVMLGRPITLFMVFTMYFSGGLIPFYFVVKGLGLSNSLWVLILPTMISVFNVMVMRAGFSAIPDSVEESARIDGAGHIIILFRIMIPLALPTIAVIVLYYAVNYWNSWFYASIFIKDRTKYPLQLVLRQILLKNDTREMSFGVDSGDKMAIGETIKYAICMIATLPVLCFYPFVQKYFIKGVMIGAVKG